MSTITHKPSYVFLAFLVALPAIAATSYTPAIPTLNAILQLSKQQASWTMTIFLLAYAISQLSFGPLANALGRKKAIVIGLSLSIIATLYSQQT